ncbi:MAG: polyketide cyclase [Actinophytocola sp.]|uniref:SRPBCC family protein n=1 Tax=Actinophytocola sp. TaxID=1872138 RepID=UPI0013224A62|nr:SRPBCC family protein [Actinophytocola sp.]MPZ79220.1 polyketide cyclase [Actinophytocola sp.]
MRHEVSTPIDAPAELVWQTITAVEKWPEWTPTMTEIRRLDDGELRVGSKAEVRQPKQPVRTWTVTELTPGTSFTWVTSGTGLQLSADHVIRTDERGAVVAELTFTARGVLAPVAGLLAGKAVRAAVDTEASSLKKWCESHG